MAAIAADGRLLTGLLALQSGLINQAQLVAAFQTWKLDTSRSLTDHLVSLGHFRPAQRSVVEAMAALHLEIRGGEVEEEPGGCPRRVHTREPGGSP